MSRDGPGRRYLRAVEAAWSKRVGRPIVVSPREFETVEGWRRRGVSLAVVLEVVDAAGRRRGRLPRSITGLAREVEEAFAAVAAGRSRMPAAEGMTARADVRHAWEAAIERCGPATPLGALLARLLSEEESGAPARDLDDVLDRELPRVVPCEALAAARREAEAALAGYRDRMSPMELRGTLDRAVVQSLRAALTLPRLTLSR
jgi:hypothetical protein